MAEAFSFLRSLREAGFRADFIGRITGVPVSTDKEETLARLQPHHDRAAQVLGFDQTMLAEQVHGSDIAIIDGEGSAYHPGVDALITSDPGCLLGVHVADCGAVYFADPVTRTLALAHSGKKGTDLNITGKVLAMMIRQFAVNPANVLVTLAPCIRPPHYEVDFAADIRQQAFAVGVRETNYHDCGLCTGSDLDRFYSYRLEKGLTGRMIALLGRLP